MPLLISLTLIVFFNIMVMVNLKMLPSVLEQHHRTRLAIQGEEVIHSVAMTVRNAYNLRRQTDAYRNFLLTTPEPPPRLINDPDELDDCTMLILPPGAQDHVRRTEGIALDTPDGVSLCMPTDPDASGRYCFNYPPPFERLRYCFSFVTENNVFAQAPFLPSLPSLPGLPSGFELWPKAQAQVRYFEGARPAAPAAINPPPTVNGNPARREVNDPTSPILACDGPDMDCVSVAICLLGEVCPLGENRLILTTFLFY